MNDIKALRDKLSAAKQDLDTFVDKITAPGYDATDDDDATLDSKQATLDRMVSLAKKGEAAMKTEREAAALLGDHATGAGSGVEIVTDAADHPFDSFGEQLQSIRYAAQAGQRIDERLLGIQAASGGSEGVSSDGGFLVQKDFSQEIFRNAHDTGQLLQRVRRIPISAGSNGLRIPRVDETSRVAGSRYGGVRSYWVDEGVAPTATKPTFDRMELELRKLATLAYVTDELLADAVALEAIYSEAFQEEIVFGTEEAIYNGNGVGKPHGLLQSAALVSQAKETSQTAATVNITNVTKMYGRMPARLRQDAVWLVNQEVESQLWTMTLANQPMFIPAGGVTDAPLARLLGRPVVPIEYCEALGTLGDIMLVNLSQYIMIDKGAPQSASSMHVKFVEDEMAFRMTYRVDGDTAWKSAVTPNKGSATQSPYIALATRA